MNPWQIALWTFIGTILTGGGVGTVVVSHLLKKGDPLTRKEVQSALVADSLEVLSVSRSAAVEDVTRARDDLASMRARLDQLERDRDTDRDRISRLETLLGAGLRYIETLLRYIIGGGAGRIPAPEDTLTPHIDPSLHAWADRTQPTTTTTTTTTTTEG